MLKKYTREQLRQLYIKLPQEIKEVASADETANNIEEICERNGIDDERVGIISDLIRNVLFGVLLPEYFQKSLEEEIKLEKEMAKRVAQEINRFIFYPIKPSLEQLYKMEITSSEKPTETTTESAQKPETPPDKDTYRELVE